MGKKEGRSFPGSAGLGWSVTPLHRFEDLPALEAKGRSEAKDKATGSGFQLKEGKVLHGGEALHRFPEAFAERGQAGVKGLAVARNRLDGAVPGGAAPRVEVGGGALVFDEHEAGLGPPPEVRGMFCQSADVDIKGAGLIMDAGRIAGLGRILRIDGSEDGGFNLLDESEEVLLGFSFIEGKGRSG